MPAERRYSVTVSPAAGERIHEHFMFLARVSESAALRLLDTLMKDLRSLDRMPERNPRFERAHVPRGRYRYLLSARRYRIVYQIAGTDVHIEDIQDCRQSDDKSIV
ncbi:MAG: type II toxin-antitoxin system RelE/ParE family toxin [Coriobacteriales bacterium]|jgi:plasmid stabilization system protein ParE|nr:type II toxin-antitoxin system RelE/ParE family toxin [Coriobacteriales bacterium]